MVEEAGHGQSEESATAHRFQIRRRVTECSSAGAAKSHNTKRLPRWPFEHRSITKGNSGSVYRVFARTRSATIVRHGRLNREDVMITVHHLDDSRSQRILWLLDELGLPYEIRQHKRDPETRLAPPELKQIHPLGKSPVIEDDGRVIAESGAIIDYVLRRYGNGRLAPAPSDPDFEDYVHWMHYAEGSGMPALIVRINVARVGEAAAPALPRLDEEIALQLGYLDGALQGRQYIMGDELSAADIQLSFIGELAAARFGIDSYPAIKDWLRRFQARPAYQAALAKGGAYSFA
jgi:glutathione S-transferase